MKDKIEILDKFIKEFKNQIEIIEANKSSIIEIKKHQDIVLEVYMAFIRRLIFEKNLIKLKGNTKGYNLDALWNKEL